MLEEQDIIEQWEVLTLLDFVSKLGLESELKEMYPQCKKLHEVYNYISSDEETIKAILIKLPDLYTMDYIECVKEKYSYWLIKQIKNKGIKDE